MVLEVHVVLCVIELEFLFKKKKKKLLRNWGNFAEKDFFLILKNKKKLLRKWGKLAENVFFLIYWKIQ